MPRPELKSFVFITTVFCCHGYWPPDAGQIFFRSVEEKDVLEGKTVGGNELNNSRGPVLEAGWEECWRLVVNTILVISGKNDSGPAVRRSFGGSSGWGSVGSAMGIGVVVL